MGADFEIDRLATLHSLHLLDTPAEREYDAVVNLAQRLVGTRIALVSLVDGDRQWFKAKAGLDVSETPREFAFCAHAVAADAPLIVADATRDPRFASNPLVTGDPGIRFYAGVPIRAALPEAPGRRLPLGTICVIDDEPREIDPADLATLVELASLVESLLSARQLAARAVQLADEREHSLQQLDRRHRQMRQAERMANIGSWRLTLADNKTEWSEQTYVIHELKPGDEHSLEKALSFYPEASRAALAAALERTIATGEPFDLETDFHTANGHCRRVRSIGELEVLDGKPVALIGVFQDITERHRMEEALRHAAHTDELTRIASRGRFNQHIDSVLAEVRAGDHACALLLIDLDNFKAVNDRLGHHAGDDVLRVVAARLQAPYLAGSFAARLGGDEFVLLVTAPALLANLPALLRQLLGDLRHSVCGDGVVLPVSATIGACWLDGGSANRSELLRSADAALYEAKRRQRGTAIIAGRQELILHGQVLAGPLRLVG